jgi:hypothetical protein
MRPTVSPGFFRGLAFAIPGSVLCWTLLGLTIARVVA